MPVVSEEAPTLADDSRPATFFLVDPLDGTREFLAGRDEYTVNIALVRDGIPVVGVDRGAGAGPHLARRARAAPSGCRCRRTGRRPSGRRSAPAPGRPGERVAAVSRSHFEAASAAFLQRFAPVTELACGSALKFCRVAEGAADVYPRLAPTSEWDVAAGHALVVAAGGAVTAPDGADARLWPRRDGFRVPGFVAWGDAARWRAGVTRPTPASSLLTSAQRADGRGDHGGSDWP